MYKFDFDFDVNKIINKKMNFKMCKFDFDVNNIINIINKK